MNDRANTIAGWILFAGIAGLGLTIVTGEHFKAERPEKMGYEVQGVEQEAGAAAVVEKPFAFYMSQGDAAKGEDVFKKCAACHNADKGGANALGPNLYGVVGDAAATGRGGFAFSDALKAKGGKWDFDSLNAWLTSPKAYAPGTKMTFAGLSNPQDRANVIAYLNKQGDHPLPLPAAPAAGPDSAAKAGAEATGADAAKAKNVTVPTEAGAAKQPKGNISGDAAPAVSGTSTEKKN
ncbi:MAG TPA: cytochrome c family protein [Sphingomonas sp.]|uniref:c-type cytochrome n=1 Tax=Sphingomonas sp. TaxID=28214 RepID=UPI002C151CEC|nr:cytochrome c family protein [Sphingomonas sp.]HMI19983.1 cytochrome c family protein [Sphingomonas sp.]